jgi:hypothetical protein
MANILFVGFNTGRGRGLRTMEFPNINGMRGDSSIFASIAEIHGDDFGARVFGNANLMVHEAIAVPSPVGGAPLIVKVRFSVDFSVDINYRVDILVVNR